METMAKERSHRPFDLERLTYALGGGEYDVQLKRRFMNVRTFPLAPTLSSRAFAAVEPATRLLRNGFASPIAFPGLAAAR